MKKIISLLMIIFILAGMLGISALAEEQKMIQLLENPGFEDVTDGEFDKWDASSSTFYGTNIAVENSGRTGEKSVKMYQILTLFLYNSKAKSILCALNSSFNSLHSDFCAVMSCVRLPDCIVVFEHAPAHNANAPAIIKHTIFLNIMSSYSLIFCISLSNSFSSASVNSYHVPLSTLIILSKT